MQTLKESHFRQSILPLKFWVFLKSPFGEVVFCVDCELLAIRINCHEKRLTYSSASVDWTQSYIEWWSNNKMNALFPRRNRKQSCQGEFGKWEKVKVAKFKVGSIFSGSAMRSIGTNEWKNLPDLCQTFWIYIFQYSTDTWNPNYLFHLALPMSSSFARSFGFMLPRITFNARNAKWEKKRNNKPNNV